MLKYLLRDLARLSSSQWLMLISLLVILNMVVMGGMVWLMAADIAPERVAIEQVILAEAPATKTALPTFTPATVPTSVLPALQIVPSATNTRVPTWTPSITPTPPPTATPTITPTPPPTDTPVPAVAAVVQVRPSATPTPSPTPDVDFWGAARQLTACENQGKHHIFVYVEDQNGNGIPGMQIRIAWVGGEAILTTGDKAEHAGLADFAMFKGHYTAELIGPSSNIVTGITPDIPQDELCPENNNPVANSLFHYSYEVTFTKVR